MLKNILTLVGLGITGILVFFLWWFFAAVFCLILVIGLSIFFFRILIEIGKSIIYPDQS